MSVGTFVRLCLTGLLVSCLCGAASPAGATGYSQLVVFGDSLSDVGNNGRFTAGLLWDEHLAGALGVALTPSSKGGTDYAISGAQITAGGINSLPGQVFAYLGTHARADAKALYVFWGGGNDVFATLGNPASGPTVMATGIADTIAMLKALYGAGARNFVVGEVPRTDLTPFVRAKGAAAMAQQESLVTSWNTQLLQALRTLSLPGARVWRYNSASTLEAVANSPTHFGFTDVTTACGSTCADPAHTFFWDTIHPGATGHEMIADAMLSLLTQFTPGG